MTRKLLGYRFTVCEFCPPPFPKNCETWEMIRYMDHRDNIEDAQKIVDVLHETDIMWSRYGIVALPVYEGDA